MSIPPVAPFVPISFAWNNDRRVALRVSELGLDKVGAFVSPEQPTPDGRGTYHPTLLGAIFQSDLYGSVFVTKAVFAVWKSTALTGSGQIDHGTIIVGPSIQTFLDLPVKYSTKVGDAAFGWFERGMIVARPTGSFVVYGAIYAHYMKLGGPTGWVGLPLSSILRAPGMPANGQNGSGTLWRFQNCDIYWSKPTGAAEVHGLIRARYNTIGASGGRLGFPTTDETSVRGPTGLFNLNTAEIGRFNRFENGAIYWSGETGAWDVDQWMLTSWLTNDGGPAGELGFPISEPRQSSGRNTWYQNFKGGVIVRPATGDAFHVTQLDIYIDCFESKGDDTVVNKSQNLYVYLTVTDSTRAT